MQEATSIRDTIVLRSNLHSNPEKSGSEYKTVSILTDFFSKINNSEIIKNIGGNSLAIVFDFQKPGPNIVFRSELDAVSYIGSKDNLPEVIHHSCGHDGHMSILAQLGLLLEDSDDLSGKIMLLFQTAEETGQGAQLVVGHDEFKKFSPDYVYALHNLPGFERSAVIIKDGTFTSASTGVEVRFTGKDSHASEPEQGINPSKAIADTINDLNTLSENSNSSLITIVNIDLGSPAFGVNPGCGKLMFTVRDENSKKHEKLIDKTREILNIYSKRDQLEIEIELHESFGSVNNNTKCNNIVRESANELSLKIIEIEKPFKWSEDFSHFTDNYNGSLFGIGTGINHAALHNMEYDFPNELINSTAELLYKIAKNTVFTFESEV